MSTITIRLDKETDARLKRRLACSGETLSEFIRQAITRHLDEKPRLETRLASLQSTLEKLSDTREVDLSITYKKRNREKLVAKHRR
jgi:Arc/MetJ-type ribon-helix-helix transcriptional regulator